MDDIEYFSHKLMIIVGIIMLILGSIGNILNIYVFTKWSHPRKGLNNNNARRIGNSPLYLLASSIANLLIIIYPLVTRILLDGYQYDVIQSNVFILCKLQYYILHTCDLISLACFCMAAFDRYLVSSREVRLRQMSTKRQGTMLIIIFIVGLNALHSIPIAVYFDVSDAGECIVASTIYTYYYLFAFHILLHSIIPIIFLSVFGIVIFKQIKIITRSTQLITRNSEKQLSRMLLLTSLAIILSSIPNCVEQIHEVMIASDNAIETSYVFLFHIIAAILFHTNPVYSFYIFYASTPNFRKQVKKLIIWEKHDHHITHNKINTITSGAKVRLPMNIREKTATNL